MKVALEESGIEVEGVSTAVVFEERRLIQNTGDANSFLYAMLLDAHRSGTLDVPASGENHIVTGWTVNDGNKVISPITSLKVRPIDVEYGEAISSVQDYISEEVIGRKNLNVKGFTIPTFTVLK